MVHVTLMDVDRYGGAEVVSRLDERVRGWGARCTAELAGDRLRVRIEAGEGLVDRIAADVVEWYQRWRREHGIGPHRSVLRPVRLGPPANADLD